MIVKLARGPAGVAQLTAGTGKSPGTVRRCLRRLTDGGLVSIEMRGGTSGYRLAPGVTARVRQGRASVSVATGGGELQLRFAARPDPKAT